MTDRRNSWYLRGYERVNHSLRYMGEWYGYGLDKKVFARLKCRIAAWALGYTVIYLAGAVFVSAGALWRWTALPQLLTLIACVYLLMAAGRICLMKEENPYRDYHAGPLRLRKAAAACLVFSGLTLAAELVFLCAYPCDGARELLYAVELAANIAAAVRILRLGKKYPCVIVRVPAAR